MAINEAFPGVEVSIEVAGQPLHEYTDPDADEAEETKTTTRYIQATSGQEFALRFKVAKGTACLGHWLHLPLHLDGTNISSPLFSAATISHKDCERNLEGRCLAGDLIQKFRFNTLEKKDHKPSKDELALSKNIGLIRIEVHHKNGGTLVEYPSETIAGVSSMSEKGLKGRAVSHSIGFSSAERSHNNGPKWETTYVDPDKVPAATFLFKYRSIEALKSEMIIQRTPSPPPLEEREDLTREETREIQRQLRELKKLMDFGLVGNTASFADGWSESHLRTTQLRANGFVLHPELAMLSLRFEESGVQETSTAGLAPKKERVVIEIDSD